MQKEILDKQRLLNEKGHLNVAGFQKKMLLEYDRKDIKAAGFKIKEWDYYIVMNDDYAVALTIADNSYLSFLSASILDFNDKEYVTSNIMKFFTFGKFKLPSTTAKGDIKYHDKKIDIAFLNDGEKRILRCKMLDFKDKKPFECELELFDEPNESMVIAIPFKENKKAFYFNQKINCMKAKGYALYGEKRYEFGDESLGTLDWGRGVWTYDNTWYWGSASGYVNGKTFGFNIGYGFGDTTSASENMIFYDGVAHKLEDVTFHIPVKDGKNDYMSPWTFTSNDKRFEMEFVPVLDRFDKTNILVLLSDQHQVFGKFTGTAVLDDGTVIKLKDFMGFAEKVRNKW